MRNFIKTGGHHDEKEARQRVKEWMKKLDRKLYRKSRSVDF